MWDHLYSPIYRQSSIFSARKYFRGRKKKRDLILSQHSPTPTSQLGSLTLTIEWHEEKEAGGWICEKDLHFHTAFPPVLAECVKNELVVRVCVWAASSEGLHLEQGGACKRSRVTLGAKQDCSSPSSYDSQMTPAAALHNVDLTHPFLPIPSLLRFLFISFSFFLRKGTVIHNPLNYQWLNYVSRSLIFSPHMEIQKQLTSSWLGIFPRKGHGGNWMTPPFTFLAMTSLLHA